ncbi:hypothetical protein SAMN06265171_111132 [Chryseobacterium rhizoplanae]|uniref:SMI1/KNR4 family protein n=1 Tax=Chryseobacterium rhizoplanae TaxID=1609531 RepID=A0A521F5K7_9FLAO|nr:hypothetical protein [Chryseobacterium rhizoplanae]SMO90941.1 hypothetical protein SAMN06265171_111132 [Chryseobacterium rhizoplanae]
MKKENSFIKHCNIIQSKYGIIIPENIQTYFAKFSEDSDNFYYQTLKKADDYKIFYTKEFVKFIISKYPDAAIDFEFLQNIIDEGNYEYSLLEKRFVSENIDFSFLNECLQEYHSIPFYIGIYTFETCGGEEFLIINDNKAGYIAGRSHYDFKKIEINTNSIKYQKIDFIKKLQFK